MICRSCPKALTPTEQAHGCIRCRFCRAHRVPQKTLQAKPQGITVGSRHRFDPKGSGESWWTKYAQGDRSLHLEAEAKRRFPAGVTRQQIGPLLKPLIG